MAGPVDRRSGRSAAAPVGFHGTAGAGAACNGVPCERRDWQPLGDGVCAAIRREPPGLLEHAHSLVIVKKSDVVVVDAQMTASVTRERLSVLFVEEPAIASVFRRLTPPPDGHAASAGAPAPPA